MNLYFDCTNGISGDMSVGALLDLGASEKKLKLGLESLKLDSEFSYEITSVAKNSIKATDFNVLLKHHHGEHHHHRNLNDILKIIKSAEIDEKAKELAEKIFNIVACAEAKVHNLPVDKVHFHEVGAIDSIVDILSFSILYTDISPQKIYFSPLSEGFGSIKCAHGIMSVPAPAVCEIASEHKIPIRLVDFEGEMITPTGIAIVASLYNKEKISKEIIINKVAYGAGKRDYPNPTLRVMSFE